MSRPEYSWNSSHSSAVLFITCLMSFSWTPKFVFRRFRDECYNFWDDMYILNRYQMMLCGGVQDLEWEASLRFPFVIVRSLCHTLTMTCAKLVPHSIIPPFKWNTETHPLFPGFHFCSCQGGLHARLLGRAQEHGGSVCEAYSGSQVLPADTYLI